MLNDVLIDAGPLIALFDKDDNYHEKIKEFIKNKDYKFHTTTAVITEVLHMLDFSVKVQIDFLEWIMLGGILLYEIKQTEGNVSKHGEKPQQSSGGIHQKDGERCITHGQKNTNRPRFPKQICGKYTSCCGPGAGWSDP